MFGALWALGLIQKTLGKPIADGLYEGVKEEFEEIQNSVEEIEIPFEDGYKDIGRLMERDKEATKIGNERRQLIMNCWKSGTTLRKEMKKQKNSSKGGEDNEDVENTRVKNKIVRKKH